MGLRRQRRGAAVGFECLKPLLQKRNPTLAAAITARSAAMEALLNSHRRGGGYVSYDALSGAQVKQLADAVNALAEPLSQLAANVV